MCYVPMTKVYSDHLSKAKSVELTTSQSLMGLIGTSLATKTSEKQRSDRIFQRQPFQVYLLSIQYRYG